MASQAFHTQFINSLSILIWDYLLSLMVNTIYSEVPNRNLKVTYSSLSPSVSAIYQLFYISTSEITSVHLHHCQTCHFLSVCIHHTSPKLLPSLLSRSTYFGPALRTLKRTLLRTLMTHRAKFKMNKLVMEANSHFIFAFLILYYSSRKPFVLAYLC